MRLLLFAALTLTAANPDWGKIIDSQRNPHHPPPHEHHTPTPEPATWLLMAAGVVGLAVWRRKHL